MPWAASLPAPFELPYFQFNAEGVDELDNPEPGWLDSQLIPVQGWDMLDSEKLGEHEVEQDFDAFLLTPSDVVLGIKDRVGLPLPENGFVAPTTIMTGNKLNSGIFNVVGHDIENYGPQLWTPGNVTLLKLVEG